MISRLSAALETVLMDAAYAWRALRKTPGSTAVILLSLGLGIAAITTTLCWIGNVVWRPLPGVARQEEIAVLVTNHGGGGVSIPDLRDFDRLRTVFSGAAASQLGPASITIERQTEWLYGQITTANFFAVLGVEPLIGRTFLPDEDQKLGGNPVLVISETYWRRRFHGDPAVIGKVIDVNRHAFTIVGVVPAAFRGTMTGLAFEFWAPISMLREVGNRYDNSLEARDARGFHDVVRLREGVSLAQAAAVVATLDAQLAASFPRTNREARHRVLSYADCPYGAQAIMGPALRLLLAVSLGVLLIVTANVANLLLGRAATRQKEMAIRVAAGASRLRLVRQMLTESLLLALAGGALGVALATWLVSLFRLLVPAGIARNLALSYRLDVETMGFALLATVATGVVFGLVPALLATRPALGPTLKEGGRSSGGGAAHHRLRQALVVGEMALALVLLVSAFLCIQGLENARRIAFGFDRQGVLLAELQVGMNGYGEETAKTFYRRIQQRLAALPGVEEAALASWFPLGLGGCKGSDAFVEGYDRPFGEDTTYEYARVSARYFAVMRVPLVAGRDFDERDDAGSPPVAIVNEHFARRFWPGQDPLGRRFRSQGAWRTVVGVAKAGKYNRLDEGAWPFFYLPYQQGVPALDLAIAVRTAGAPSALAPAVQRAIHDLDPGVDLLGTKTLASHTEAIFFAQRTASILLTLLGALGVLLAAMGVYAVMAYAVSQRTQEFGLRAALGADERSLLRLVVGGGLALALLGCAAGLVLALAVTRLLAGFLFGVSPFDPLTFVGVPVFLTLVTALACYLPGRRAARVDPMVALRCE